MQTYNNAHVSRIRASFSARREEKKTEFKIRHIKDVLKSRAFEASSLPHFTNNRQWDENLALIQTAITIFQHNLATMKDLRQFLVAFELLTRHTTSSHIFLDSESAVEQLAEALRVINKVLSPQLIVDWCLRCYPHLKSTKKLTNKS